MRKIKINPKYEYLRAFIESIPDVFEQEGRVIYTGRNLIKVLTAPDGTQINIKRFHEPHGPNKLIYSWNIRKPKGQRAFEYPMILKRKGINTRAISTHRRAQLSKSLRIQLSYHYPV